MARGEAPHPHSDFSGGLQMTRGTKRWLWRIGVGLAGLMMLAVIAGMLVVRSAWFYDKVRHTIVAEVEKATGGHVEIRQFSFDWKQMRAEVRTFALHGTEPADKPPLFNASSVAVGIKVVSIFKKQIDLQYLDVIDPRVYLIIYPDGRTNVPEPKLKRSDKNTIETILDLAIGRFNLQNGIFEVESRGETRFDARGQNLNAQFRYELTGPRYRGNLSVSPLDLKTPDQPVPPVDFSTSLVVEKNHIEFSGGKLASAQSTVDFSGTLDDLNRPRLAVHYNA